jgi:hypothetical protein
MQKRGGGILDIILKEPICCLIIFSYMPLFDQRAWVPISSIRVWNNF